MAEWEYVRVNSTHINKLVQLRRCFIYYYVTVAYYQLTD